MVSIHTRTAVEMRPVAAEKPKTLEPTLYSSVTDVGFASTQNESHRRTMEVSNADHIYLEECVCVFKWTQAVADGQACARVGNALCGAQIVCM